MLLIHLVVVVVVVGQPLGDQADAVTRAHCCTDCCVLSKLGYEEGKRVVYDCMAARDSMTRAENKDDLRAIVKVRAAQSALEHTLSLFVRSNAP